MKQVPVSAAPEAAKALRNRFSALWQRIAPEAGGVDPVWRHLHCCYTEPHRLYHNLEHIDYSLQQLDRVADSTADADAIELAIWFHDVIYELDRHDNEARSAELLGTLVDGQVDPNVVALAQELILATTHKAATDDPVCQLMLDIDLAGFGRPWAEFVANSIAIREEQQATPAEEIAFLDMLDERPRIFQSPYFYERLESKARKNIARYRDVCARADQGER